VNLINGRHRAGKGRAPAAALARRLVGRPNIAYAQSVLRQLIAQDLRPTTCRPAGVPGQLITGFGCAPMSECSGLPGGKAAVEP